MHGFIERDHNNFILWPKLVDKRYSRGLDVAYFKDRRVTHIEHKRNGERLCFIREVSDLLFDVVLKDRKTFLFKTADKSIPSIEHSYRYRHESSIDFNDVIAIWRILYARSVFLRRWCRCRGRKWRRPMVRLLRPRSRRNAARLGKRQCRHKAQD